MRPVGRIQAKDVLGRLAALCAVTLLGGAVAAAVRSMPAAIAAAAAGYLTPLAAGMTQHEPAVWMIYLLALTGGVLLLAATRRWNVLSALAMAGTLVLMSM